VRICVCYSNAETLVGSFVFFSFRGFSFFSGGIASTGESPVPSYQQREKNSLVRFPAATLVQAIEW